MSAAPENAPAPAFAGAPEPEFEIVSVEPVPRAVAPTLQFNGRITTDTERPVYAVALTALFTVEPAKRKYDPGERERLEELFGAPERWSSTTGAFRWAQVETMVPGFKALGEFALAVPCTYDLELASGKYFGSLADGAVPLRIHFNGTVFYEDDSGGAQVVLVPWDRSIRFDMPISAWQRDDRRPSPQSRLDPARDGHGGTSPNAQGPSRLAHLRRLRHRAARRGGGG